MIKRLGKLINLSKNMKIILVTCLVLAAIFWGINNLWKNV